LSNRFPSPKWAASLIERFLWEQATARLTTLEAADESALGIWDERVLEKPESSAAEGLCAVRSCKAARLKRIKPGSFNPPGGRPICVPGLHWLALLVLGHTGAPTLALRRWWTTRGLFASDRRSQEQAVLRQCAAAGGQRVLPVFDRGFAGSPWLGQLFAQPTRGLVRWPKGHHRVDVQGPERTAWQIARGKKTWDGVRSGMGGVIAGGS
jgi:hypothetical protein